MPSELLTLGPSELEIFIQGLEALGDDHCFINRCRIYLNHVKDGYLTVNQTDMATTSMEPLSRIKSNQQAKIETPQEIVEHWLRRMFETTKTSNLTFDNLFGHMMLEHSIPLDRLPGILKDYASKTTENVTGFQGHQATSTLIPHFEGILKCGWCGKDAEMRCLGCIDTPTELPQVYCNKTCQKEDWNSHKKTCQHRKQVKALYKGASLLAATYFMYCECYFPHRVEQVREAHGVLFVHLTRDVHTEVALDEAEDSFPLQEFRATLFISDFDKKAIMAFAQCDDVLIHMQKQINLCFKGICVNIEEVPVLVRKVPRPVYVTTNYGDGGNARFLRHTVLRLTLKSGQRFCVDVTGAQFGLDRVVMPWDEYKSRYVSIEKDCQPLGSWRKYFEQYILPDPTVGDIFLPATLCFNLLSESWEAALSEKQFNVPELIKESKETYTEKTIELVQDVRMHFERRIRYFLKDWKASVKERKAKKN